MLRLRKRWNVSLVVAALLVLAIVFTQYVNHSMSVQAQSNRQAWKVIAISPDANGASVLEAELLKGGWAVESLSPAQYNGAQTLVVLKSLVVAP